MLQVLGPRRAVDKYVIEKHQHKPLEVGVEDVVHQSLESGRGIGEPKRHDQELEVAMVGAERCLGDVVGVHPHLVVPGAEVKLGEELIQ
jgi:hypothetical protein